MRPRILIFCAVILTICVWLLLHHRKPSDHNLSEVSIPPGNQPSADIPVTRVPHVIAPNQPPVAPATSVAGAPPATASSQQMASDLQQRLLDDWQRPIDFYGRVVDENTNPIVGANVAFGWSETPSKQGERKTNTVSDADGLFSLQGQKGPALDVWVSKDGYYSSHHGQWGFVYAHGVNKYVPDTANPVIFVLHKKSKGEPLIHIAGIGLHTMRDYMLEADGKPIDISLMNGKQMPGGQGDLQVEFQAGKPLDNFPSRITWQCRVSVPNGGLIPTSDEFPFSAPENGYVPSDEWSITSTNWTEQVQKQYFLRLGNGDFGRVIVRIVGVSSPYLRMESFVNPSGSPNLEPSSE